MCPALNTSAVLAHPSPWIDAFPALDPADCGRGAKTEHPRRLPSALAVFDKRDRPRPEVLRVSLRHRATSLVLSKQPESDLRAFGNPLTVPIHINRKPL